MPSKKKKTTKAKPGRPRECLDKFSEEQIKQIKQLAGFGLTTEQIASFFGMSKKTYMRRQIEQPEINDAFHKGVTIAISNVAQTAYQMAMSGKVPAMTMFFLKCRAGWREKVTVEHEGSSENPVQIACVIKDYTKCSS